jgi:ketosteroid isomerase-like protein
MSEQNVAIVRAVLDGGGQSKEAILATLPQMIPVLFDPEVEFIETPERVDARTFRGHQGVQEAFERFFQQWSEYSIETLGVEDHDDRVFASVLEHGRGGTSGAAVDATLYVVFTFRAGRVIRYQEFYDEDAARGALGE